MAMSASEVFNFVQGSDITGHSSYDIWKSINPDGTEAEFIEYLNDGVKYGKEQSLTDTEKQTARTNIGIGTSDVLPVGAVKVDYFIMKDTVTGNEYIATLQNGVFTTNAKLVSIEIIKNPDKLEYVDGDKFDPTGMVVQAKYSDGTTKEITDYIYPEYLYEGDTSVEISYIQNSVEYKATVNNIVVKFNIAAILMDFDYTDNNDGTYTITEWNGTTNGAEGTECIIPDSNLIVL